MPTTIAVRFPLGRFHATRWDGGANTSDVEWPPSPWRILRALLATRHTRWPDLDAAETQRLLAALGTPAAYRAPATRAGSTRHYMPLLAHRTDASGGTSQVIDGFLAVDPEEPLLIQWHVDLTSQDRTTLRKLVELVPYLGRSESLCDMTLVDQPVPVDSQWWRLGVVGSDIDQVRLLTPTTISLAVLEQTTVGVRKARRTLPPDTAMVVYGRLRESTPLALLPAPDAPTRIQALRFELTGPVPLRARSAVLAADAMHGLVSRILQRSDIDPEETSATMGLHTDGTLRPGPHEHLHILPVPVSAPRDLARPLAANTATDALVLWARRGIRSDVAAAIIDGARSLFVSPHLGDELPSRAILFAGSGPLRRVYPTVFGPAREWISWFPYLLVRHRKKGEDDWQFVVDDVQREAPRHGLAVPEVLPIDRAEGTAGEIAQFRRRRNGQNARLRRRGVYVRLRFAEPVSGPIVLGQLSHFGYGLFVPVQPEPA